MLLGCQLLILRAEHSSWPMFAWRRCRRGSRLGCLIEKVKASTKIQECGQAKTVLSDGELRKKIQSFLLLSNVVFIPIVVLSVIWVIERGSAYANPCFIAGMLLFPLVLTCVLSLIGWYGRHTKEHNPP